MDECARTALILEVNCCSWSGPLPRSLAMRSRRGVEMPLPMAPARPSAISATSTASACTNTDIIDDEHPRGAGRGAAASIH
jgi:hypothetical protein